MAKSQIETEQLWVGRVFTFHHEEPTWRKTEKGGGGGGTLLLLEKKEKTTTLARREKRPLWDKRKIGFQRQRKPALMSSIPTRN